MTSSTFTHLVRIEENLETERSFTPEVSKKFIDGYLKSEGLICKTILLDDTFEVSHVELLDADGQSRALGSGKGKHHLLGAQAEAIEHLISKDFRSKEEQKHPLRKVANQSPLKKDFYLQAMCLEKGENLICTEKFRAFREKGNYRIPAGYVDPFTYDNRIPTWKTLSATEKQIAKLACNNGTSLGLCFEDSVLHGLNECIERHYMALLCQEIVGHATQVIWEVYDDFLNLPYQKKRSLLEEKCGDVITLYTRTAFGSFAAFSLLPDNHKPHVALMGGGSSIFLPIAIQRSMDELAQTQLLTEIKPPEAVAENKKAIEILNSYERLRPLITMPKKYILSIAHEIKNLYPARIEFGHGNTAEHVEYLLNNIKKYRYTFLYRTQTSANGIWITQVFVPGFDIFFLILNGILVMPIKEYGNVKALATNPDKCKLLDT